MDLLQLKRTQVVPSLAALVTLIATGFAVSPAAAAPQRGDAQRSGARFTGSGGFRQTPADLMRLERLNPSVARQPILVEDEEGPDRDHLRMNPASPRVASIPGVPVEWLTGYRRDKGLGM